MIDGLCFVGRNPATGLELTPEALIADLDRRGVDAALGVPYRAIFGDRNEGEAEITEWARRFSGRLLPTAVWVGPRREAGRDSGRLKRLHRSGVRVLAVIKQPSYYEPDFRSLALKLELQEVSRLGWSLLAGVTCGRDLTELAETAKGLKLPILVRFMGGRMYQASAEITAWLESSARVRIDVSNLTQTALLKKWVAVYGAKRFFFASGAPEHISGCGQAVLESAGLLDSDLEKIRHGNLSTLLGLKVQKQRRPIPAAAAAIVSMPKIDTHWHTGGWNLDEPGRDPAIWASVWKRWNIRFGIFSSVRALNGDLEAGNAENFEAVSRLPGAHGLVVVDPTRPEISLREIRRYAKHPRMAGLKTIQDLYGLKLDAAEYRPLLDAARKGDWTVMAHKPGMAEAAARNPRVRFVAAHMTLGRSAGLTGRRNIWLDLATSHADAHETRLPQLVQKAGVKKILFASDAPLMDPAWTAGKIADACLPAAALKRIFYQNALDAFPALKRK